MYLIKKEKQFICILLNIYSKQIKRFYRVKEIFLIVKNIWLTKETHHNYNKKIHCKNVKYKEIAHKLSY